MAVVQPDGKILETYATIVLSTGQVVALSYTLSDPKSACDGYQNGRTASMLPVYAELIDDQEVEKGAIDHAIAITAPAKMLSARIAYPAYAFDRDAMTNSTPYGGASPMGARLAIPPTVDLSSLGLQTLQGRTIARAAQKYGFIITDRGGDGITLRVRANAPKRDPALHTWNPPLQSDLNLIFGVLQQVK